MRLLPKVILIQVAAVAMIAGAVDWYLLKEVKDQLMQAQLTQTEFHRIFYVLSEQFFVLIATGVIVTVAVWVFILRHYFVSRLRSLHQYVHGIGDGNLSTRIEELGQDEIGDLGRAINNMVETLEHTMISKAALDLEMRKRQQVLSDLAEQKFALDKHAIVAVTDVHGTITYVNQKFCSISGYSEEELIGQNHRMLNSGVHSKDFFREMYRCIGKGEVWSGELCNRAKDRRLYWVDTTIVPLKAENGKPRSYIAIRADITERKHAEIALAESSRQLELIISSTEVGVWDWDIETGLATFNERWAEIVGYSLDELKPTTINTWQQLAHPDDLEESSLRLQNHWDGLTDHYSFEARMKHKDGHWVWVFDTGKVVEWSANGKPKRMIGTHLDISERKHQELENEAAQVALEKAKIAAEQASNAKSEFLASMSHEIRTPMNGVLGMLELLQNGALSQDQRRKVEIAQSSAQSLLTLINDILDYSKVDAGKLELEAIDFNLLNMMSEFAEGMAYQAQKKNLELVLDMSGVECAIVRGDPARLRQVLTNLVGNAIKFTEKGDVVIRGMLSDMNATQWRFTCSVIDTGIGIPEESIQNLFQYFSQLDASTTRKYGGTGLGLAIVKKLCELMGGKVSVSSSPEFGSCFEIEIVLEKGELAQKAIPAFNMENLNVLIVDDSNMSREVIQSQLRVWGASVRTADNAETAWHIAETESNFDIVLIDLHLPDLEGVALGSKFKNDPRFQHIKVVMMTNIAQQNHSQLFTDLGFSAYCQKPITVSALVDTLSFAMNGSTSKESVSHLESRTLQKDPGYIENNSQPLQMYWPEQVRILLVEDNQVNQMVAKGILHEFGLQVDIANNGQEALAYLRHHLEPIYHLIFMDCQMPIMDGYEATKQIRAGAAGEQYKDITVIAMTANAMAGDKEKCLAVGMNDYLSKPLALGDIIYKLNLYLPKCTDDKAKTHDRTPSKNEVSTEPFWSEVKWQDLDTWRRDELLERMVGTERLIAPLLTSFLSDFSTQVAQIKQAATNEDWSALGEHAHTMKGIAANLGARKLSWVASNIERASKAQNTTLLSKWLTPFNISVEELKVVLEQELQQNGTIPTSVILESELGLEAFMLRIEDLCHKIEMGEYVDVTELEPLKTSWLSDESKSLIQQLSKQLSMFDAQNALSTIAKLIHQESSV